MSDLVAVLRSSPPLAARVVAALGLFVLTALGISTSPPGLAGRYSDAWVYLAAGERLNSGHNLYALGPSDRPVMLTPVDAIPLLSPPPIAVFARPLALLGEPMMAIWCAGALVASLCLLAWGLRFGGWWSLAGVLLFGVPLLYAAMPGNANAYIAPLLALAWRSRRRPWLPAAAVVAATAVKLTPIALVPWVLPRPRLLWAAAFSVAVLTICAVAAPGQMTAWLSTSGASQHSPASIAGILGTSPRLTAFVLIGASWIACWALRRCEGAVFTIGLLGSVFATPAFYFHTLALLAPLIALDGQGRARSLSAGQLPKGRSAAEPIEPTIADHPAS